MEKAQVKAWNKKVIDCFFNGKLWGGGCDKQGDYWYILSTKKTSTSTMIRIPHKDTLLDVDKMVADDQNIRWNDTSIQKVLAGAQYGKTTIHDWTIIGSKYNKEGKEYIHLVNKDGGESYLDPVLVKEIFGDWRKYRYSGTEPMQPIFVSDDYGGVVGVICPCRYREEEKK